MWYYKKKQITNLKQVPEGAVGFIYKITEIDTNRFYIGKKQLYSSRRTRMSKREKEATASRKTFKTTVTESNWLSYWSSSKKLQALVKDLGEEHFIREILEFCFTKRDLNYREVWTQFHFSVLENDTFNDNIASRWFRPKET